MSSNAASMVTWAHPPAARRLPRSPGAETVRSRDLAHLGGFAALLALVGYLTWRVAYTLPSSGLDLAAAWALVVLEAVPLVALTFRLFALWDVDAVAPAPVARTPRGMRVVVLVPTYAEPADVLAPTVAAACALEPAHETWVLDDGARPWVEDMCRAYGARYVSRAIRHEGTTGSVNHALSLMSREGANGSAAETDVIAVLDCEQVPLPSFLTASLGWFADPEVALVQAPQACDGDRGLVPGSFTVLARASALRETGGFATGTGPTAASRLADAGWRTEYHHQALAVAGASATLVKDIAAQRRSGIASILALLMPLALLVSGAQTSTASPLAFAVLFSGTLAVRTWGTRRLLREEHRWTTGGLALHALRVSVGLSCLWSLITRRAPTSEDQAAPRAMVGMLTGLVAALAYAAAGLAGVVPWRAAPGATVASGAWVLVSVVALGIGTHHLAAAHARSSRTAPRRFAVGTEVAVDGFAAELVEISVNGADVRLPFQDWPGTGLVELALPGAEPVIAMLLPEEAGRHERPRSLRTRPGDWAAVRALSLWLFHTPPGAVPALPNGFPAVASAATSATPTRPTTVVHHD